MYLIVGLGNPGQQYSGTRHNVGFMMLDYLAEKNGLTFSDSRWQAQVAKSVLWNESAVLLKPQAYMNASGTAVARAAHFYKVEPARILVIHDDLDMAFGRMKIVSGGGDGGHKGIRSIIEQLGTRDFPRFKIGIGRPPLQMSPEKYVLERFDAAELERVERQAPFVLEGIRILLQQGPSQAMNVINQRVLQGNF